MMAAEYFEDVARAARKRAHMLERLERARASAELHTQQYEQAGGTGDGDPPAFNLVALEDDFRSDLLALEDLLDEACLLLYGEDGRGGLAMSAGFVYADAIAREYLFNEPHAEAARDMDVSPEALSSIQRRAFAALDAAGVIPNWH